MWLATFAYAAFAAVLVQLVILPHLLPAWHAGSGLLVGGDWIAFHNYAVDRAEAIRAQGWRAFELRPHGNAPIGIASAVYALTWPAPWTLIPLNAALHATAAILLCHLLLGFVTDWRRAVIGAAPFVLYPSALVWVSQIHKEGWFIVGYLSLSVAWADLARASRASGVGRALLRALVLVPVGFGLIWLVRPDLMIIAQASAVLALLVLVIAAGTRGITGRSGWRRAVVVLGLVGLTSLGVVWMSSTPSRILGDRSRWTDPLGSSASSTGLFPWTGDPLSGMGELAHAVRAIPWYRTAWLPASVDRVAYRIALVREIYLVYYEDSRSNTDPNVGFYRATDLARYLPRALQIALLAPFPKDWADPGSSAWTTVARRIVALEMLGVYLTLIGLAPTLWRWRRQPALWVVILPSVAVLALYSLAIPNLGALHRFRYGFLMTLVGLGVAGGLELTGRPHRPRPTDVSA